MYEMQRYEYVFVLQQKRYVIAPPKIYKAVSDINIIMNYIGIVVFFFITHRV